MATIVVGKLASITFAVVSDKDIPLAKQVRLQLARFADNVPAIKSLFGTISPVTVMIKAYRGSGAVTIHKNKMVVVSKALAGGVPEIAESALFELVNWSQGDFATRAQSRLKNSEITAGQAGRAIASCEAVSVHTHGVLMDALKKKGIRLSAYGEAQRTGTLGKSREQVQQTTMISSHDSSAAATDMMSLHTPDMYFYQTISGVVSDEITIRAINGPPLWLEKCIKLVFGWNEFSGTEEPASLYVKLLNLAEKAGCTIKDGYEFNAAMKIVAKETSLVSMRFRMSSKTLPNEAGMPENLATMLKDVKLIA